MEDQINVEDVSAVQKRISISVSPKNVDRKYLEFFSSFKDQINLKGFRQGKVPLKVLKQHFGDRAKQSVSELLLLEYFKKALDQTNLNPIGAPIYEPNSGMKADNSYFASLLVEILPKIQISGYRGLKLVAPKIERNKMIEEKILNYRTQFAERRQVERALSVGDTAVIDFTGYLNGQSFQGGSATGYALENVGRDNFISGFGIQMVGMLPGEEKQISIKFPENYQAAHLADKEVQFQIKLHSITEIKIAEVNDDLAMMVGYTTVDELQGAVESEINVQIEKMKRFNIEEQVITKLAELNPIDLPKSLIEGEKKRLLGQNQNPAPEVSQIAELMAKQNTQKALMLDAIYEQEPTIEITPDELDNLLGSFATEQNISKDELVSNLYNAKQMDAFMGVLRAKKALDLIISEATIEGES